MLQGLRPDTGFQEIQLTMNNDHLSNVLSAIKNSEIVHKTAVKTASNSKVVQHVLDVLKQEEYIEAYTIENDGRIGQITITLKNSINNIGSIKPRFSVKTTGFVKFEKRYLPAQGFGIIIVSTPKGIMTHEQAKEQKLGGRLLAYCY